MQIIYNTLFERIISGEYKSNTFLKEEALAKEFKVSRTPVRDALKFLEFDGLIKIQPKKGNLVLGFSIDDAEEIYDIRKALEVLALKKAISKLSIQDLLMLKKELLEIEKDNNYEAHADFDARLHDYFIQASGNKRLISVLNQMLRLLQRFRTLGFRDAGLKKSAISDHLKLIDALCMRDWNASIKILEEHLEESKRNAISHIVNST